MSRFDGGADFTLALRRTSGFECMPTDLLRRLKRRIVELNVEDRLIVADSDFASSTDDDPAVEKGKLVGRSRHLQFISFRTTDLDRLHDHRYSRLLAVVLLGIQLMWHL